MVDMHVRPWQPYSPQDSQGAETAPKMQGVPPHLGRTDIWPFCDHICHACGERSAATRVSQKYVLSRDLRLLPAWAHGPMGMV